MQWRIKGMDQGGLRPISFKGDIDRPPSLISGSEWPLSPYLKVWIHHCNVRQELFARIWISDVKFTLQILMTLRNVIFVNSR